MTIEEIFKAFEKIGCLTFTSVNEKNQPESRIAHLRAFDDDGIYFMTMFTKDFCKQLEKNPSISVCGLCADTKIEHDANGKPTFDDGYAIRMTGKAQRISIDEIKAKKNPIFDFCIYDQEKYKAMVVFCIKQARGDIFDYDFSKTKRDNKLNRIYFSYNGEKIKYKGLKIDDEKCISCGICKTKCSFLAIKEENKKYTIDRYRCDECGDCYINCPKNAISK